MVDQLEIVLAALSGALLLVTVVHVVRDRPPGRLLLGGLALLEGGLVVQSVIGFVALAATERDVAGPTFVGYLVGIVLVVPVAVVWALAERSRSGTAVLLVATVVVPVLILRLDQVWAGPAGG